MSRNDQAAQDEIESLNARLEEVQEELELALSDLASAKVQLAMMIRDREAVI